jgi:two-component sensor histidine kinase
MAMVHEKLYQSVDLAHVEFADYARSLMNYLRQTHGSSISDIQLQMDLEPVFMPLNTAVPCGLILNEVFNNTLKHAFVGRESGKVTVSLRSEAQRQVFLAVRDNGIGLPPGMDVEKVDSLGLRLVQMLAKQLKAAVEVKSDRGTKTTIIFEVPESCTG